MTSRIVEETLTSWRAAWPTNRGFNLFEGVQSGRFAQQTAQIARALNLTVPRSLQVAATR
jgi:hypothetical protein